MIHISLDETVYDLVSRHPEIRDVMVEAGFGNITKPGMLATAGRFMTIPKGAALKKLELDTIKQQLYEHGFSVKE